MAIMASATLHSPVEASVLAKSEKTLPYYVLFFISGFPALLYQIVWQRALFTIYGVNVQSVTVIVTVFMLGLGLGSLAGGRLSTLRGIPALRAFGAIEFSIGVFGILSLPLFHAVARFTAGASTVATGGISFLLLLIPTLLMGSTLPLLVEHLVRRSANVGESVGSLYAVNTAGSAFACLLAALFLMRLLGESGTVWLAASFNILVGTTALLLSRRAMPHEPWRPQVQAVAPERARTIPLRTGMLLAGVTGFIALAFEILWYRLYSFASGGSSASFAKLLAFYLFGIAYGSVAVHDICRKRLQDDLPRTLRIGSLVVMAGTITAFLVGPLMSVAVRVVLPDVTLALIAVAAALLGAAFPLLSHASIGPHEQAGKSLGYLYLSNIIGSALGSFLIGFVVLDHWSTGTVSLLLLGLGLVAAAVLAWMARPATPRMALGFGLALGLALTIFSPRLFFRMYERLLYGRVQHGNVHFISLIENRSGVIAVDSLQTVYGNGVYDGHFNLDPIHDTNGVFRPYVAESLPANPKEVLMIGLSSGSWAQIVASDPRVQHLTVVEINPGYLPLIREHPEVASLLHNPKVQIVIDDGRRWLVSHPDIKFDYMVMNTTQHWRANATNLLSVEFLELIRQHMNPGGVAFYNTTDSPEVQATGARTFPYVLRISNHLAVSDSPVVLDRGRLRTLLENYRVDGRPVFDLSRPEDRARLEELVAIPEQAETHGRSLDRTIETRASLMARLQHARTVTDDNMAAEWQ
ncbi:MAG: fused MFS/spermidine synthase [Acidobacteriaceae bacterium]